MVLVVDYRFGHGDLLVGRAGGVQRFSSDRRDGFSALSRALESDLDERLEGVAVVLPAEGESGQAVGLTWSAIRGSVALGNALAFAWGVPAVRISSADQDQVLLERAVDALAGVSIDSVVSANYDGSPNITRPKSAIG